MFIIFLLFSCAGDPLPGMPGSQVGPVPIISMYGVTMSGNSIATFVHGFAPYFYIPALQGFQASDCITFRVGKFWGFDSLRARPVLASPEG